METLDSEVVDTGFGVVPADYVGPLSLPGTGRAVFWTGRVAIGLRHEPPRRVERPGEGMLEVQRALLRWRRGKGLTLAQFLASLETHS